MLLWRDIAEHSGAEPTDHRRTDSRSDMIITRRNIRGQRPQRIKRRLMTFLQLLIHILLDQMHGYMSGPFDDDLAIMFPGYLRQLTQRLQLRKLRRVIGVRDRTWPQSIPQRERDIICLHDLTNLFKMRV